MIEERQMEASRANQSFAMKLYREVAAREGGNFVISPLLFSIGLALLQNGADPLARDQIASACGFEGLPVETLNRAVEELIGKLDALNVESSQVFALATSIWASQPLEFAEAFVAAAQRSYSAEVRSVKAEDLPARVSKWALEKTRGLVDMRIDPIDYVLLLAAYFRGRWHTPFDKRLTRPEKFFAAGSTKQVEMMTQGGDFSHLRAKDYQVVELPFCKASACFLLPEKGRSLADVEREVFDMTLTGLPDPRETRPGLVRLPRFRIRFDRTFNDELQALGMTHMFESFDSLRPAVTHPDGAKVGLVIQNSFISVDEEGAEAASVLAMAVSAGCAPDPEPEEPFEFVADRPFCFWIRDDATGSILFVGRMADPEGPALFVRGSDSGPQKSGWRWPWKRVT